MYTLSTPRSRAHGEHDQHVEGRMVIEGRRLRYEAGSDIACVTLQILKEFVADCESEFFDRVQVEQVALVRPLIEEGERLYQEDDLPALGHWLGKVGEILPRLWD